MRFKNILLTGSSGLIGQSLLSTLKNYGHNVSVFKRSKNLSNDEYFWDPENQELNFRAFKGIECVIHLAGEPIAQRWNHKSKDAIFNSRILGTRLLVESMKKVESKAKFICSSGINFYGAKIGLHTDGEDAIINGAEGFLSQVCHEWEAEAKSLVESGNSVVCLRTGVVLNKKGGALARMLPAFQLALGGVIGSGKQWMSWIELDDLVKVILWSINSDYSGPLNAVAPSPVQNKDFVKALGRILKRPTVLPMPKFLVDVLFGAMGRETVLADIGVIPCVLKDAGFEWNCSTVESALKKALDYAE